MKRNERQKDYTHTHISKKIDLNASRYAHCNVSLRFQLFHLYSWITTARAHTHTPMYGHALAVQTLTPRTLIDHTHRCFERTISLNWIPMIILYSCRIPNFSCSALPPTAHIFFIRRSLASLFHISLILSSFSPFPLFDFSIRFSYLLSVFHSRVYSIVFGSFQPGFLFFFSSPCLRTSQSMLLVRVSLPIVTNV